MKKLLVLLIFLMSLSFPGYAQDTAESEDNKFTITTKQGYFYSWEDQDLTNLTTFEIARTEEIPSWGKWNVLWKGWSLDAGFAYDSSDVLNTGAILIGRNFGTLGEYLPIDFPLQDRITITLYAFGIKAEDLFDSPEIDFGSGVGIIKFEIKI